MAPSPADGARLEHGGVFVDLDRRLVAAQANELANAATADFDLSNVTVTKKTFAGSLLLSEQVIDWSTPSMLDAAVNDLAIKYALATEDYVVDQMAAAVTHIG